MAKTTETIFTGKELEDFNRWTEEFGVSSRYIKPIDNQERHYFDSRFFHIERKSVTFYHKFVTIVKNIL